MSAYVGDKIKELRIYYNIYQEELAEGICTQATISRIEKNEIIPNSYILHQIAKRLGVDMDYFYGSGSPFNIDYVKEVHEQLAKLVREKNFKEVLKIVKLEKNNPLFQRKEARQILLLREGISIFNLFNDSKKAFSFLYEALTLTSTTKKNTSSVEMDILTSIAAIHDEIGESEKAAEIYADLAIKIKKLPASYDPKLGIRITYNSAVNAHLLGKYEKAINFCNKNIYLCLSNLTFYALGETYFQKGESIMALSGDRKEALTWMKKSQLIFELVNNQAVITYVNNEVEKLTLELS